MNAVLPIVCLARHGETAWSLSGQHTGLTDLPLTERGESDARSLEPRLKVMTFLKVFSSPLKRAVRNMRIGRAFRRSIGNRCRSRRVELRRIRRDPQRQISTNNAQIGNCSGDGCPGGGSARSNRSTSGPRRGSVFDRSRQTPWCFPAVISCACWRPAG